MWATPQSAEAPATPKRLCPFDPSLKVFRFHLIRMLTVHKGNDCAMSEKKERHAHKSTLSVEFTRDMP
jgi:hypothetical protein